MNMRCICIFLSETSENLLKNNGFSRKAFSAWAINRELIKHTGKRDTVLKRDGGSVMRLIAVKIADIKSLENEQRKMRLMKLVFCQLMPKQMFRFRNL